MSSDDLTKNFDDHALLLQLVAMFRDFDARQRDFDARLQSLERKVDERLYDTRPMWETVRLQINELRGDISGVGKQVIDLRDNLEKGFRRTDHKVSMFVEKVVDLHAYQRDMEERLEKLEPKAS